MPLMPKRTKYRKMQKGRNRGRANRIRKRTSHIEVVLKERD